jgi:hypothetical protein
MPIILPEVPIARMTTADAVSVAKRMRTLLRAGRVTHRQMALVDCLMWSCRNPATGVISASYTALARLAHVARATIAKALCVLEDLGVLTRIKRRVRMTWHQGGTATRQATSAYLLHPSHTEFSGRTVIQTIEVLSSAATDAARVAAAALACRRQEMEARMLHKATKSRIASLPGGLSHA